MEGKDQLLAHYALNKADTRSNETRVIAEEKLTSGEYGKHIAKSGLAPW
jgi:hypothetical protein